MSMGPWGTALRADADVVGAVGGVAPLPRPLPASAAPGAFRRRHLFLSSRKGRRGAFRRRLRGRGSPPDRPGYNFDLCPARGRLHADVGPGRPHCLARRNELSAAGPAGFADDDARAAGEDRRVGRGGGHGGRFAAAEVAQPFRLPGVRRRSQAAGRAALGRLRREGGQTRGAFGKGRVLCGRLAARKCWPRPACR